ncbi:Ti-type conjugative transfer relaxase TraA [Methylobacterium sp. AMS5]|uniref:Ti-type conjugative transfer relaxase TraA n=1 Tax=Methylobacterium sp. AMS5 TaxID=925818 RepID=UPI00074F9657|nr:Ti-type conjugative transfer relaxase TraA [Methylobacterium sp. AMS5]AMB48405.1 conjugal transfer protein TraA [Methylobacterium sp. AMS5]
MAIYHLSMKQVSRASGRSAVASAAYRSAERMENRRDGQVHDYTGRHGVTHTEIVLPEGAQAEWAKDRSALWNAAEAAERRKDARVAREYEIALPHELLPEARVALAREFAGVVADRYGVAVDMAIHAPHGETDARNHHAHLLATTRRVTPEGLGAKADCELENRALAAQGLPSTTVQLVELRRSWEQMANAHLARAGHDLRIDGRSYAERGLEIVPTQHMGVHATRMERRGREVTRGRLDAEAAERNAAAIRARPDTVLALITEERSVFDRRDIARTLHRYLDGDAQTFRNAFAAVMAWPALVELQPERTDPGTGEVQPARYVTREMVALETGMAEAAGRMHVARGYRADRRHVERALAQQDAAIRASTGDVTAGLSPEQRRAIGHVTGPEGIAAVVGFAGAGKSTMLAAAREAWERQGYRVHGAALSGKASEGLEESSGIASRTLASWSLGWDNGHGRLGRGDVLVIDEAGMVGSRQLARFVAEAERAGAKLVLVGDHEQLQAIGAGAPFRAIAERIGHAELSDIRRQRESWQRTASVAFATHRTDEGLAAYRAHGAIVFAANGEAARGAVVRDYLADREARPEGTQVAMAHRRADVRGLNAEIRGALQERGALARGEEAGERTYQTNDGARAFAPGDRIVFLENSRTLGVKNGMLGTVERAEDGQLTARLDGAGRDGEERRVSVPVADYPAIDHGYATTIHKTQGATVDRAFVLASGTMDRHLTYVAMTRHRDAVQLYASTEEFAGLAAGEGGRTHSQAEGGASPAYRGLEARLSRSGAKATTLDYPEVDAAGPDAEGAMQGFAERRGIAAMLGIRSGIAVRREPGAEPNAAQVRTLEPFGAPSDPETVHDRGAAGAARQPRRGLFAGLKLGRGRPTGQPASGHGAPVEPEGQRPAPRKRGMFDGLQLDAGRRAASERVEERPAAVAERDRLAARLRPLSAFEAALDRYARASGSVERHRREGLPVLEAQTRELAAAGEALDAVRPGSHALLRSALTHDSETTGAMVGLAGPERVERLAAGLERERAALADPSVRAERFVRRWQDLQGQRAALQHREARAEVEGEIRAMGETLERDPEVVAMLSPRRRELGIALTVQERQWELARSRGQGLGLGL